MTTTVLSGGRIEIQHPELVAGQVVTIHVVAQDVTPPDVNDLAETIAGLRRARLAREARGDAPKRSLNDNLADYNGGRLFNTAAEVDAYIKDERDSWGDT